MVVIPVPRAELELMRTRLREADRLLGAADAADCARLARSCRREARRLIALVIDGSPPEPPPQEAWKHEGVEAKARALAAEIAAMMGNTPARAADGGADG